VSVFLDPETACRFSHLEEKRSSDKNVVTCRHLVISLQTSIGDQEGFRLVQALAFRIMKKKEVPVRFQSLFGRQATRRQFRFDLTISPQCGFGHRCIRHMKD
jgi:hypothetical protein